MKEGLLWLDADPKRSLRDKIIDAADRYRQRFGEVPDRCYCNAGQLERPLQLGRLQALPAHNVQPYCFWVGVERSEEG